MTPRTPATRMGLGLVLTLACLAGTLRAAVWNADSDGNWNDPAKWTGGVPSAPGATADLNRTGGITADRTVTLDIAPTVGNMTMDDSTSTYNSWILSGANTLTFDDSDTSASLTVNRGRANAISAPVALTDSLTVTLNNSSQLTISGAISGTGTGLTKAGGGTLILGSANGYTGTTSINNGMLVVTADGALGTIAGNTSIGDSGTLAFSGGVSYTTLEPITMAVYGYIRSLSGNNSFAGNITQPGDPGGRFRVDADTFTYAGNLSGNKWFNKYGGGTLKLTGQAGPNAWATGYINAGTLSLSGVNGKFFQTDGSGTTAWVKPGATLELDNTAGNKADRIAVYVTLEGATFRFLGNDAAASAETISTLTLNGNQSTVDIRHGTGQTATVTAGALTRSLRGTVLFRGTDLGDTSHITFTSLSGGLVGGGGAAGTKTISILPYAYGDTGTGDGNTFVTNNVPAGTGIRPLNVTTEFVGSLAASGSATDNVRLTAGETLGAAKTVNALLADTAGGAVLLGGAGTLTLTSGALLTTGANDATISAPLSFGATNTAEAVVTVVNPKLTISSNLATTGGLTKSGAGILELSGNNTALTGGIYIHGGSVTLASANAGFKSDNSLTMAAGTSLDLNGVSQTVAGFSGSGAVTNSSGTLSTLEFTAAGSMSGNLAGNLALLKSGTGSLELFTDTGSRTYTGATTITGGTLNLRYNATAVETKYLGAPGQPVVLNGGTFFYSRAAGAGSGNPMDMRFGNNLVVNVNGGSLRAHQESDQQQRTWFDGTLELNGNLDLIGSVPSPSWDWQKAAGINFTALTTLKTSATVNSIWVMNGNAPVVFYGIQSDVHGADHTLTLSGKQFELRNTAGNFDVKNLVVDAEQVSIPTPVDNYDFFATLRSVGGKVTVNDGKVLNLYTPGTAKPNWQISDFQFAPTAQLVVDASNWGDATHDFQGSVTVGGTAPGAPRNVTFNMQTYNTFKLRIFTDATELTKGTLTVGSGGTLTLGNTYGGAEFDFQNFDTTLLGGGALRAVNKDNSESVHLQTTSSGGKLVLGDGNAATPETITIGGYSTTDNGTYGFMLAYAGDRLVDDGNVTLRYESTSGVGANKYFVVGWQTVARAMRDFQTGSAGTEFAPATGTKGLAIVGPATGQALTLTSTARLVTAGTVGFYNSTTSTSGYRSASPGPITVGAGGQFLLQAAGTVQASALTVTGGGRIGGVGTFAAPVSVVSGSAVAPGNSIGTLSVTGNLAFDSSSFFDVEFSSMPGQFDRVNVAGDLSLGGATLRLADLGTLTETGLGYPILTYTGTLSGNPFGAVICPNNFSYTLDYGVTHANEIWLTVIPEPSALALLALSGLALWQRQRRERVKA